MHSGKSAERYDKLLGTFWVLDLDHDVVAVGLLEGIGLLSVHRKAARAVELLVPAEDLQFAVGLASGRRNLQRLLVAHQVGGELDLVGVFAFADLAGRNLAGQLLRRHLVGDSDRDLALYLRKRLRPRVAAAAKHERRESAFAVHERAKRLRLPVGVAVLLLGVVLARTVGYRFDDKILKVYVYDVLFK